MATPHDEHGKKKNGDSQTPGPKTPKPPVPNMSLDSPSDAEPVEDAEIVEEVPTLEEVEEDTPELVAAEDEEFAEAEAVIEEDVVEVSGSAVLAEEDDEEAAAAEISAAEPASGLAADEAELDELAGEEIIEDAVSASEVSAAEEIIEDAAPASDVLFDEVIEDAAPVSDAQGADVAESGEDVSSATRRAEGVLDDEAAEAEVASAGSVIDEADAEEVLDVAEGEATEVGSSAVLSDTGPKSDVNKTAAFDQTMAFEPPASGAAKAADAADLLVTEEDVEGTSAASAVDLGEMPARKGSSVTGIDKVAEAIESGVDLDSEEPAEAKDDANEMAATVPSVEFDELLDEETEMEAADAEAFEMADEPVAETPTKKGKTVAKATTGDDLGAIDEAEAFEPEEIEAAEAEPAEEFEMADDVEEAEPAEAFDAEEEAGEAFDAEAEAAEAFDADDAEVAEPAEALDEDEAAGFLDDDEPAPKKGKKKPETSFQMDEEPAEAAVAVDEDEAAAVLDDEDETPKKKDKKKSHKDEDEEAAEVEEDEEDVRPKKKKKDKKKDTELAEPAPAQSSTSMRVFIGMVLATILIVLGIGALAMFAPEDAKKIIGQIAELSPTHEPIKAKDKDKSKEQEVKPAEKSNLEKALLALADTKYQDAIDLLKEPKEPAEFAVRGEAKWFVFFEKNKDADDFKKKELSDVIDDAKKDLKEGKNEPMIAHIDRFLDAKETLKKLTADNAGIKDLQDQLAKAKTDLADIKTKLDSSDTDKKTAEKKLTEAKQVMLAAKFITDKDDFTAKKLEDVLKTLTTDLKGLDDKITAINDALKKAKATGAEVKGIEEIAKARDAFEKDRDDLAKVVDDVAQELAKATILADAKDARTKIVQATKQAIRNSESPLAVPAAKIGMSLGSIGASAGSLLKDGFKYLDQGAQVVWFHGREKFIQTPEQKLANHVALLQDRGRRDAKELADITREADWVRTNPKADAESKAKARYVQGLALRNLEKFAEAKKAFEETLAAIPKVPAAGSWQDSAHKSHRELVDPDPYYVKEIKRHLADNNSQAALNEATIGLKAIPGNAILYSQRAMIRYETVRGKGPKAAKMVEGDIRADAAGAAADVKLKAEAKYIEGLLEEELGNFDVAEKLYKDAIDLHQGEPDGAARYRISRARLLLRDRTPAAPAAAPAPADDENKKADKVGAASGSQERTIVVHPWSTLVVVASVGQDGKKVDALEDKETLRLNETLKLADELIKSTNDKIKGQGYLLRGSAISKMGKRTEGLKEYAKGLRMVYPNIETKELQQLIDDHPAFQLPDTSEPNPIIAERFFGEGIHFYWAKKYPDAEAQMQQAIRYYEHDPRFWYYLGLAQWQQKTIAKRDAAIHSFELAARLEVKNSLTNPDTVRDVNASLERIQGELRQTLNEHRYKITNPEPEK